MKSMSSTKFLPATSNFARLLGMISQQLFALDYFARSIKKNVFKSSLTKIIAKISWQILKHSDG